MEVKNPQTDSTRIHLKRTKNQKVPKRLERFIHLFIRNGLNTSRTGNEEI